jgi:membrane AbrB-like protein
LPLHLSPRTRRLFGRRPVQWTILFPLSAIVVLVLEAARLPAALLLGPMIAAIALASSGALLKVPRPPFLFAQGVVGCLMARSISTTTLHQILEYWPVFLLGVVGVILASGWLGWLLARWRVLPGTSAIWGTSPGASTAMMILAEAHGADIRLVAFMQYLRVFCLALLASVVASIWVVEPAEQAASVLFHPIAWLPFAETLLLAGLGAYLGQRFRVPGGSILLTLGLGVLLQDTGIMTIELPSWLLAGSYALIGWSVGLRFTPAILSHAMRAFLPVLASIVALVVICAGLAVMLVALADVDPLTAYLATSPGGADAIAIIAASSEDVDLSFVMAMQTCRILIVMLVGPPLARFLVRHAG